MSAFKQMTIQKQNSQKPLESAKQRNQEIKECVYNSQEILNNQQSDCQQIQLKCRVHTMKLIKYVCLDQNCDHQRFMCPECENTDHFVRHRNKCILISELSDKADTKLSMQNWPQDSYLRIFQDYLKGQNNEYENVIVEMCNRLLKFMKDKIEELAQVMVNLCDEQQKRNQEKNRKLLYSFVDECNNLDSIREIVYQVNTEQNENNFKYLQISAEKQITQIVNQILIHHTQYKQQLNQQFGFGYFESKNANKSLLDFNLIQQEFDQVKEYVEQMSIFIEKNATNSKQIVSPRSSIQNLNGSSDISNLSTDNDSISSVPSANPYSFSLSTIESELDKISFRLDDKSATVKKVNRPTFFFSNIIPQQSYFQLRITGLLNCGTYIGLVDEGQKNVKVNPQIQQNHFVGICLACQGEHYGNCKTNGTGFNFNAKDEEEDINYYYQDENQLQKDNEPQVKTIILNIFINLTKKVISFSDISNEQYLKFDLDNKNYFYNRDIRLFVQTQEQIKFEVLQYNQA
ncbi:hypothetical protein TTHERM_00486490 (macronuclear) [Tetrahymena thermophila SB210]|uniref:Uncharacterized protein n=1 Tax=Tetrahymena thermophila (strain SB210) TaxID=312017 RepID=I7M6H2_TETTS|nr:hypothetical protein TTHERM_00486490 [Tetrahymena thermophila SB210]EAR85198.2 hypothetical protein TTHERM_00486490 [Tetrahymena thermophila SB210]|eukprot:XP_001032861.2 hypothetical protein TTHERM_00486490 [Tetrahymena thermophila SB210]